MKHVPRPSSAQHVWWITSNICTSDNFNIFMFIRLWPFKYCCILSPRQSNWWPFSWFVSDVASNTQCDGAKRNECKVFGNSSAWNIAVCDCCCNRCWAEVCSLCDWISIVRCIYPSIRSRTVLVFAFCCTCCTTVFVFANDCEILLELKSLTNVFGNVYILCYWRIRRHNGLP